MKKGWKITLIVVGSILLILIGLGIYVGIRFEHIVKTELVHLTEKKSNGLYRLNIEKIRLHLLSGKLKIKNIDFEIDTVVLKQLEAQHKTPHVHCNLSAKSINANFSSLRDIIRKRYLDLSRIDIYEPHVVILQDTSKVPEVVSDSSKNSVKHWFSSFFSKVDIHQIRIHQGYLEHRYRQLGDSLMFAMENMNVQLDEIILDATFNIQGINIPQWQNLSCEIGTARHFLSGGLFNLYIHGISGNFKGALLSFDSVALIPKYGKYEFTHKSADKKDWMQLHAQKITLSGFQYQELLICNNLHIDSMGIDHLSFASFKNRQDPPTHLREKPLFHTLIHDVPFNFNIPKIAVKNSRAVYEELALTAKETGKITFDDINADIDDLTNIVSADNQVFTVNANAKIMNSGLLKALFSFPVSTENEHFEIRGSIGAMNLASINPILLPAAHLKVENGQVDRMDFFVSGKSHTASIDMTFLYHDLKVEVLKKDDRKFGFATGIVNNYVLLNDNPKKDKNPRSVHARVTRNPYRSNFDYWWQLLFAGIKETAGITEKKQDEIKSLQKWLHKLKKEERKKNK